jgi:nitroimidazol reductase NimA-like FMN-containing flavoprotein (pyridoxamine 5'-phosphate oxidase superfamily)
MELLADGGVGRLAYTSRYGPTALPVAYKIDGGSIVCILSSRNCLSGIYTLSSKKNVSNVTDHPVEIT